MSLRARAVWVEQQWGKHWDAIGHLREIVALQPDFEWAWMQLAQYFDRLDDLDEYLPAAQKLVELDPRDPLNWGYLGDACNRTGDRDKARSAWEKAIDIAPGYDYAGISLFELHWQAKDYPAAMAAIDRIEPHIDPESYLPAKIKVAVHRQDLAAAKSCLARLCECNLENSQGLRTAISAMNAAGLQRDVESILATSTRRAGASDCLYFCWLETAAELQMWQKLDGFVGTLDFSSEIGAQLVQTYLRLLARHQQRFSLLAFIDLHHHILRSTTALWGTVGHALRVVRADRRAIKWSADWLQRKDAEPWMLGNLNEALRAIGDDLQARHVNQVALRLSSTNGREYHLAWIAYELVKAKDIESSGEHLQQLPNDPNWEPEYQFLVSITKAMAYAHSIMGDRRIKLKAIEQHLAAAKAAYPEYCRDLPFARAYLHALWRSAIATWHLPFFKKWFQVVCKVQRQNLLSI